LRSGIITGKSPSSHQTTAPKHTHTLLVKDGFSETEFLKKNAAVFFTGQMPSHHPINGAKVEKELKARSQKNHRLASSGLPTDS